MIEGYVRHGLESNALRLYEEMQRIHFEAKFVNVCRCFNACCGLAALEQGKQIHVNLIKSLFYFGQRKPQVKFKGGNVRLNLTR
jgi:hypothetical protein